ncbi:MAG: hypothetical protein FWD28_00155 [Treponema sp.]|nr:hypothetical protein [Treponema sp.]
MIKKIFLALILTAVLYIPVFAQTHEAVPLGHPVYVAIEQAQMRGLIGFLPHVKPYSRERVISILSEILENNSNARFGALTETERRVLEQYKSDLTLKREGLDLTRGVISFDHTWNDIYFSGEFGFGLNMNFAFSHFFNAGGFTDSGTIFNPYDLNKPPSTIDYEAVHPASGDSFFSYDFIPTVSFKGDIGNNLSYGLTLSIWAGRNPRTILGEYLNILDKSDPVERREMLTYSEPWAYFPFSYKKRWDGYVWTTSDISTGGMRSWPEGNLSVGYSMMPEMAGTLLNGHIFFRFARLDREWAGMSASSSLILNEAAQPFLAMEAVIRPFEWMSISALTGVLEYHNAIGDSKAEIQESARVFQNAFSIVMLELNISNFLHIDFGSTVVWPKRFELGYLFPFADNFIYQTNIGDFDNMALFFNAKTQYPGIGKLWLSLFIDEMSPSRDFFQMAKMMFAYQFGGSIHIPWLPFSSITVSYTKIEPYNYSHIREDVPWYPYNLMETNYVSFGKSLGHYIPPNSDELLIRFEVMPQAHSLFSLQYQLIRHGANYGSSAVAGSSLWSELLYHRNDIRKHFLRDGAYQWMHIVRLRGEYSLTTFNLPIKAFAEVGGVYSYFTNIDGPANEGSHPYKVIDTSEYPHSFRVVATLGIRIFPKF